MIKESDLTTSSIVCVRNCSEKNILGTYQEKLLQIQGKSYKIKIFTKVLVFFYQNTKNQG